VFWEAKVFANICLTRNTVAERISDISTNLDSQLKNKIKSFVSFSVAVDESTDISDIAQLAISVANLVVFPRIWACFFWSCGFFEDLRVACFWACFNWNLLVFWACFCRFLFFDCLFFKFYGNFMFQFSPKGILCVFLWKFGHFGLVFQNCHPTFLFKLLADFSFCCIFLPTHVGLVFRSNYLFLVCFSYILACFCKITWHHC